MNQFCMIKAQLKNWIITLQKGLPEQLHNILRYWHEQNKLKKSYPSNTKQTPLSLNKVNNSLIKMQHWYLLRELEELPPTAENHERRCIIGDRLALIGDNRYGVGVKDGIPEIDWLFVKGTSNPVLIDTDEYKIGPVTISAFYIARYQITYQQYQAFVESKEGLKDDRWWIDIPELYKKQNISQQLERYGNSPCNNITWYQAIAFTRWLDFQYRALGLFDKILVGSSSRISQIYREKVILNPDQWQIRLPTEYEWQWAAQAGDEKRNFPWGDWQSGYANTLEAELGRAVAVGMYLQGAAQCGALDMAGNLYDWCLNDYELMDNLYTVDKERKILRGGSFNLSRSFACVRCATSFNASENVTAFGFRVVLGRKI